VTVIDTTQLRAGGLAYAARTAGQGDEAVLLLHGFPETSRMWEPTLEALAATGRYRAVAPDQRGYSPGARPTDVEAYNYGELGADVFKLADAAGFDRFHLVGHDWGAGAAWCALAFADQADVDRVVTYTALSVPHYRGFAEAVRDDPEEALYRGFLDLVVAPDHAAENVFATDDFAPLKGAWDQHDAGEVADYLDVLTQPGALTAALNWYRACRAHARALDDPNFVFGPVSTPTMLIWGADDPYVRRRSLELAAAHHTGPYEVVEVPAGHWLVQQAPEPVIAAILRHLDRAQAG
jgi:pimeloyl-ACP methyl ester carboxylesterase